jgi:DNA polymerase I-like protein with 3'-5' exonuclease and polymerase domains
MTQPRPFAEAVLAYAQAGWPCILPVPVEKSPPPVGYTGADGRDTDPVQLAVWAGTHAESSIALRMPDGVIGIDVDSYEKHGVFKHGAASLNAAIEKWGPLPATWSSTARGDGPSRISFYRVPPGRYATKLAGGDVEIIQRHHRYAVVWPSPHTDAGTYTWYDPAGVVSEQPPKPNELPDLPQAWVDGLREGATDQGPAAASRDAGEWLLEQLRADNRTACAELTSAALTAVGELTKADAGSRHDTATARVHHLVQLAAAGHPGLPFALPDLEALWAELTAGEDRGDEWERMLLTSARKAVSVVGASPVGNDPCLLIGSIPVAAPAPDVDNPEPIEPPRQLHPLQVIGAHLFDPQGFLDQTLAQAVLERTYPALRYAHDAKAWLLRGPETWDTRSDLAEWAVALLADLMPRGNPDAEKGSDARDQAERRKKFMTATSSGAIAKKTRALVAGGVHPCSLKITDLDREPWLLWAGGVAWDLRDSAQGPAVARIDPSTPHLRSAGVLPENRPTPLWDAFTAAVWPDPELRAWGLRVLSIALTGYSDKALPILIGEKDRGKTQIVALLMSVLGSYAHAADPRLLSGVDNAHASIIYALMGRRLSFIDEGPRDGKLGQERLKQLTGGGDLTGNQMNTNPVSFKPTHTLVLTANDEPLLTDPAVRGRARLIPCEGDPERVIAARAAIGHPSDAAWRREAPGVLAAMMREAAAWLADRSSALTTAAPEAYRFRGEEIAAEQDPIASWIDDETEPHEDGERSRALYEAFVGWCRNGNMLASQIPSETKWGRELGRRGYLPRHTEFGKRRPLRLRPRGGWFAPAIPLTGSPSTRQEPVSETQPVSQPAPTADGLTPSADGLLTGSETNPSAPSSPAFTDVLEPENALADGLTGSNSSYAHTPAHTHARKEPEVEKTAQPVRPVSQRFSAQLTASLLAKRGGQAIKLAEPVKPKRAKVDPEVRAAVKLAAKAAALAQAIADASGEPVTLPAVVTRDGAVRPIALPAIAELVAAFGMLAELTVDVETTGYPIGHADYALRTIQLGNEHAALVFDASDPEHTTAAAALLEAATVLHAHSATADLIPLATAGQLDLDHAWDRMHDTVIPAKLADPSSTGSDPGLKQLSATVLEHHATAPAADEARAALFKAGKWLTDTKATTPLQRSGWAQVDPACTTMVRYAASDVLDTAALAKVFFSAAIPPAVLERERTAQRMTARVAHEGLAIDGAHVAAKLALHTAERAACAERVRAFGIDNPGSDQQVGVKLAELGAQLPRTATGRLSVARGAIEALRNAGGRVGELVAAVLEYRHHDTVLGTFLEPYQQLVTRGDSRARPTVYTLGADTGRMSCVRPNLQQMPRQGGIRACITADPGTLLVSADFASVEIRVAAALSGDANLQQMLAAGVDLHWEIARQVYGPEASKEDRYNVKRGVFGRLYGSGIPGIARTLSISESEAASMVDTLDAMTPALTGWSRSVSEAVKAGHTQFPSYSGRTIHLPKLRPHAAPNYCVTPDTLILRSDLRHVPASEIRSGDRLVAFDEYPEDAGSGNKYHRMRTAVAEKVSVVRKRSVTVRTEDGKATTCSADHLWLVRRRKAPHRGPRIAWARAEDLLPGDWLLSLGTWGEADSRTAGYLAGLYDGEGSLQSRGEGHHATGLCFSQLPGLVMDAFCKGMAELGLSHAYRKRPPNSSTPTDSVQVTGLRHILQVLGTLQPARFQGRFEGIYEGAAVTAGLTEPVAVESVTDAGELELVSIQTSTRTLVANGYLSHNCIQGTARELLVDTLVKWRDTRWGDAVLLPVHDEIVAVIPEADATEATAALVACMETELGGVAIKAEASEPSYAWKDAS